MLLFPELDQERTVGQIADLVSELTKTKQLHKAAAQVGFELILRRLRFGLQEKDAAAALATLGKIGMVVRGARDRVSESLSDLRNVEPPDILSLNDPDDRYYAATFWRFVNPPWTSAVLARCSIYEDTGETFRRECLEGLLNSRENFESALADIIPHVKDLSFTTESPTNSKAKRLRRVLTGLRSVVSRSEIAVSQDAGLAVRELLLAAFLRSGAPEEVKDELSDECFALLHDCVRAQFSVSTWPKLYAAVRTLRDWYKPYDWERFVLKSRSARALCHDVEFAIEILARAGVRDAQLLEFLPLLAGSEQHARSRMLDIAKRNPGLSEEVSTWLSGRATRKKSNLAAESQFQKADEILAELMIQANEPNLDELIHNVLPRLRILDETSASVVTTWIERTRVMRGTIDSLFALRNLSISGAVGDVVEFSPMMHEFSAGSSSRMVRIITPMVVAHADSESFRVVRKALVETV